MGLDLPLDPALYPVSGSVATELVGTSVTSDNLDGVLGAPPRTTSLAVEESSKAANRHIRYLELDSHGYSVLDVTPARTQLDRRYVDDRTDPSWVVPAGTRRVQAAAAPV